MILKEKKSPPQIYIPFFFLPCPHAHIFIPTVAKADANFSCHGGVVKSEHILHLFPSQLSSIGLEIQNINKGKKVWFVSNCNLYFFEIPPIHNGNLLCVRVRSLFWRVDGRNSVNSKPKTLEFGEILCSVFSEHMSHVSFCVAFFPL